jgi:hypothetical protein
VVGKLVASSLNAFYGLVATLPVLAIPLLMGGVTGGEFWRVTLVLLNTLFFSLAAGMFASALTKSARGAAGLCMLIVLGIAGLLPLAAAILSGVYHLNHPPGVLLIPSPGYALFAAYDFYHKNLAEEFRLSLLIIHGLSWVFLIASCLIVPRSWQDKAASVTQLRWRERWLRWTLGNSTERQQFRERLLSVNAFYWLASRSRFKPALVWALLGAAAAIWLWGWLRFPNDWINAGTFIVTGLLLNTVMKTWFTGETCAQLAEDRRTGALELLLSTPLGAADVVRGQFRALCRQFLWPLILIFAVEITFMIVGLAINEVSGDEGSWVLTWIAGWVVLLADLTALFYVGLLQSLTARNANRASSAAVVRILALPWILFALFLMFIAVTSMVGHSGSGFGVEGMIVIWTIISLGVDVAFVAHAKTKLESDFRALATTRYTPPAPLWQRLFGGKPTGA